MIPLPNHHCQWGVTEVVLIYPDICILYVYAYIYICMIYINNNGIYIYIYTCIWICICNWGILIVTVVTKCNWWIRLHARSGMMLRVRKHQGHKSTWIEGTCVQETPKIRRSQHPSQMGSHCFNQWMVQSLWFRYRRLLKISEWSIKTCKANPLLKAISTSTWPAGWSFRHCLFGIFFFTHFGGSEDIFWSRKYRWPSK